MTTAVQAGCSLGCSQPSKARWRTGSGRSRRSWPYSADLPLACRSSSPHSALAVPAQCESGRQLRVRSWGREYVAAMNETAREQILWAAAGSVAPEPSSRRRTSLTNCIAVARRWQTRPSVPTSRHACAPTHQRIMAPFTQTSSASGRAAIGSLTSVGNWTHG